MLWISPCFTCNVRRVLVPASQACRLWTFVLRMLSTYVCSIVKLLTFNNFIIPSKIKIWSEFFQTIVNKILCFSNWVHKLNTKDGLSSKLSFYTMTKWYQQSSLLWKTKMACQFHITLQNLIRWNINKLQIVFAFIVSGEIMINI